MTNVFKTAQAAKQASIEALQLSAETKNIALAKIAEQLEIDKNLIVEANKVDLKNAAEALKSGGLSQSMYNRLKLDENKLRDMIQGVKDVIKLQDPVNKILWEKNIADGILLKKVSCPIGVIGIIFEARPDVISQISALAVKSSNAVILKGGSEAAETNKIIFEIINRALSSIENFPKNTINLLFSREDVKEMLEADKYIDLIIPRGSNKLVQYIKSNTKIPVLGHSDGVCHIYIDETASLDKVIDIVIDSKCQYPSACNSVETLLVHQNTAETVLKPLLYKLKEQDVKIHSDETVKKLYPDMVSSIVTDWHKEYSEKEISVKIVTCLEDAINHINTFGSKHTDCIITETKENAEKFMMFVDSAGVYHNISTRFADGFRYGFGAEVGISANKTHARGPVGLEGLTIYKYKLIGNGDIVSDFVTGKKKFF